MSKKKVEKKVEEKEEKKVIRKSEAFRGDRLRNVSFNLFTYECESLDAVSVKGYFQEPHVKDFGVLEGATIICSSKKEGKAKIVLAI